MNQNSELLKAIAQNLTDLAKLLMDAADKDTQPAQEAPKHTLKDVRSTLADYSRAGYTKEVKAILSKFGAQKLSEIKEEDYEAVLAEAGKLNG